MGLFYKRINDCAGWVSGDLVSSAKKLLKLMFKKIGEYKVARVVAGKVYKVTSIHSSIFTIDLDRKTCSYVKWQYYSVDNYKITYAPCMVPLEGPDDWEEPRATIFPLLLIRKQGRPRKNKRKAYHETLPEKKPSCCSKCK
ncbi:hypothetical protein POM88_053894 [Heracleum sosnowskyi]|uniref:Uncharacterized protein n=1 Tax=Heracleum sosnowskyi TaxID=360622 RepID=A0AAD8LXI0_9APIA|nr:hypothetical protein POM88_053894 [Heracleum sosnowskyi]